MAKRTKRASSKQASAAPRARKPYEKSGRSGSTYRASGSLGIRAGRRRKTEGKRRTNPTVAIEVPKAAAPLVQQVLDAMELGKRVSVIASDKELTTFEAADVLNVSRPYVVRLLDEGKIPCRRVGTHRRVLLDDLLDYKRRDDARRGKTLEELSVIDQQLGLGYET